MAGRGSTSSSLKHATAEGISLTQIHEIKRSVAECCSRSQNFTFIKNPTLWLSADTNSLELDTLRDGAASARAGSRFPSATACAGSVRQPPGKLRPPPAPSCPVLQCQEPPPSPVLSGALLGAGGPVGCSPKAGDAAFRNPSRPPCAPAQADCSGQTGLYHAGTGVTALARVCETGTPSWQSWSPWLVVPGAGMAAFVPCHPARGCHAPQSVAHSSLHGGPCWTTGRVEGAGGHGRTPCRGYPLSSLIARCSQHRVTLCLLPPPPWGPSWVFPPVCCNSVSGTSLLGCFPRALEQVTWTKEPGGLRSSRRVQNMPGLAEPVWTHR